MSEKAVLKRIRELEALLKAEKQTLRKIRRIKPRRIPVSKRVLKRLVKRNVSTRKIARHFKVSKRTITRRIKEYGLKGIRPKGRKPLPLIVIGWIETSQYLERLDRKYHFAEGSKSIPYPYINTRTLVCSNRKANPKGKFNMVQVYFIVQYDKKYLIFDHSFIYRPKPVSFKEILSWAKRHSLDNLRRLFARAKFSVEKVIGYGFIEAKRMKVKNEVV